MHFTRSAPGEEKVSRSTSVPYASDRTGWNRFPLRISSGRSRTTRCVFCANLANLARAKLFGRKMNKRCARIIISNTGTERQQTTPSYILSVLHAGIAVSRKLRQITFSEIEFEKGLIKITEHSKFFRLGLNHKWINLCIMFYCRNTVSQFE